MHYEPGTKLQIRHHEASPPSKTYRCFFGGEEWTRRQTASLQQLSDDYPPAKGGRLGVPTELNITKTIRTGKIHHSQVVKVDVPAVSKKELVAKFYDPFQAENEEDPELNVFWLADQQYAAEAAAYAKLGSLQGTLIPKCFDSYTCELPTGLRNNTRFIRLILLEFIEGIVMASYSRDAIQNLPQTTRKTVMYKIVDAESRIYASGVRQADIHPRNVILGIGDTEDLKTQLDDPNLRLRLFDFGQSKHAPFEAGVSDLFRGQWDRPVSPILRCHVERGYQESFEKAGWVDWDWQEWVKKCWADSTLYDPITTEAENAWLLPSWSKVLEK